MTEKIILDQQEEPVEIISGVEAREVLTALQAGIMEHVTTVFEPPQPEVLGFTVIGDVAEGEHTIGESHLDVCPIIDDTDTLPREDGVIKYMADTRGYGFQQTQEVVRPELTYVNLYTIIEKDEIGILSNPSAKTYLETEVEVCEDPSDGEELPGEQTTLNM